MSTKKFVGRPAGEVSYRDITYNDKEYVVGTLSANGEPVHFIFDKEEEDKVKGRAWHRCSGKYISSSVIDDGKKKEMMLHNLVSNILDHAGKGSSETIDHINRIGFDNRKENLRILSQAEQNMNQTNRKRNIILPEGCGIDPSEIPRHIWYIKPNGLHGDRFAIEFKTENLCWKTTSSKSVSLPDKLNEAKKKLLEFYEKYPQVNPFDEKKLEKERELLKSYQDIVKFATDKEIEVKEMKIFTVDSKKDVFEEIVENKSQEKEKKKEKIPTQWKTSNIYRYIQQGKESCYKQYLHENNDLTKIPDFEQKWESLLTQVKGSTEEGTEPILREFVEWLRKFRHDKCVSVRNAQVSLEKEDRNYYRADGVLIFIKSKDLDKIAKFKADTEAYAGDDPDEPKWRAKWNNFVSAVEKEDDDSKKKKIISNFLISQRKKKQDRKGNLSS